MPTPGRFPPVAEALLRCPATDVDFEPPGGVATSSGMLVHELKQEQLEVVSKAFAELADLADAITSGCGDADP